MNKNDVKIQVVHEEDDNIEQQMLYQFVEERYQMNYSLMMM
jgi:hypothetical protein